MPNYGTQSTIQEVWEISVYMCSGERKWREREREERGHDQEGGRARALRLALWEGAGSGEVADQAWGLKGR